MDMDKGMDIGIMISLIPRLHIRSIGVSRNVLRDFLELRCSFEH